MKEARRPAEIHISKIDQFLAGRMLDTEIEPRGFTVSLKGRDGTLTIGETLASFEAIRDEGIDFELSPSEYLNLHDAVIEEYINRPVHTSSAYELFDFIFMYFVSFDCVVEFTGNAWKIRIINPVPESL